METGMETSGQDQPHVILWAVPRSISTAFFRSIMNRKSIKVLLEPFAKAYYFGTERVSSRYESESIAQDATFKDIKSVCEQKAAGYEAVFIKDMAYYLTNLLDTDKKSDCLPNCTHTFIIRNPHKTLTSLYKMSMNKKLTGWTYFDPVEGGFPELYKVYRLASDQLGQDPVVIDADDLLAQPEKMLRRYCQAVGLTYDHSMLEWETRPEDEAVFKEWTPWFEDALTSTSFVHPRKKRESEAASNQEELPKAVKQCIEDSMPCYEEMYAKRLQPE